MCVIRDLFGSENEKKHCHNDIKCPSVISSNMQRYKWTNEYVEVLWHRWTPTWTNKLKKRAGKPPFKITATNVLSVLLEYVILGLNLRNGLTLCSELGFLI